MKNKREILNLSVKLHLLVEISGSFLNLSLPMTFYFQEMIFAKQKHDFILPG